MSWINKYVGILYRDKGRSLDGADCWGIVYLVLLNEFGVRVPTYTEDYASTDKECKDQIHDLVQQERQMWSMILPGQEQPGDIINLRIMGKDWHTGIVTQKGQFLHTLNGHEAVVESYNSRQWNNRIAGFFRHEQLVS